MEIDIVHQPAVFPVLEIDFNCISNPHPHERAGHRAVESPEAEAGAFIEQRFLFNGFQIDADDLGFLARYRRRDHRGIMSYIVGNNAGQ
jgi:hypothetical protein